MAEIYPPQEDSYLLQKYVEEFAKGFVLDMGTGTGIQAITASKKAKQVIAADINPEAVKQASIASSIEKIKNIEFIESDLFSSSFFKGKKFDLIIFNPPYLPKDEGVEDIALFSGKRGEECTVRFLDLAADHLEDEGIILLISSSLADQKKIYETCEKNLFDNKVLEKEHYFFEDVFVHRLKKKSLLKRINSCDVYDIKQFAHGKRGAIYLGKKDKIKVAIKASLPSSDAPYSIENEIRFLKILNKENIGPKLLFYDTDFFGYSFIDGTMIIDFFRQESNGLIKNIIRQVFDKMRNLDKMGINKFEMHHPVKHIIIDKDYKAHLIDFERARFTEDPKNVTQFCNFLCSNQVNDIISGKGLMFPSSDEMIDACKSYKDGFSDKSYEKILKKFKLNI